MSTFEVYFKLGLQHILDINGADHILYVLALSLPYYNKWRKLLLLLTAFTIGHSVTLALSVLEVFSIQTEIIEFLIPVTITITAVFHLFSSKKNHKEEMFFWLYLLSLIFGLIHGAGFSNYLKQLLSPTEIIQPLVAFNIGLEVGQIIIASLGIGLIYLTKRISEQSAQIAINSLLILVAVGGFYWSVDRVFALFN